MVKGVAESRAHWMAYALGIVATSVAGPKGVGPLTKSGAASAKSGVAAAKTGVKQAVNYAKKADISRLLPYNQQYQLVGVNVPFNVVDGRNLKDQLLVKAKLEIGDGQKVDVKGTGKYNTGSMIHIYHGEINKRGKAVGYHHESMMGGKIIPGSEHVPDKNGVYKAKVEIDGVEKVAKSSFFPKEWNRVDVLKAIDEAYQNKKQIGTNK